MKGNVTIKFNQATMVEAVQMYLDAQLTSAHTVARVKSTSGTSYNEEGSFEIEFTEKESTQPV